MELRHLNQAGRHLAHLLKARGTLQNREIGSPTWAVSEWVRLRLRSCWKISSIEVLIFRLRRRLGLYGSNCSIHTLHGIGYLIKEN